MIRFIVETVSQVGDRNGNTRHFAVITSTKTRKRLTVQEVGGPSNMQYKVMAICGHDWDAIHYINCQLGVREWKRRNAQIEGFAPLEHQVTPEWILDLEKE